MTGSQRRRQLMVRGPCAPSLARYARVETGTRNLDGRVRILDTEIPASSNLNHTGAPVSRILIPATSHPCQVP